MELKFIAKRVYGRILYYPANPQADAICTVANRKTLSGSDLELLNLAGIGVTIKAEGCECLELHG